MGTTAMDELTQSDDLDTLAANSPGPGLLILSTTLQLIYSDRRAWDICKRIQSSSGKTAAGVLPPPVTQVCEEVVKEHIKHIMAKTGMTTRTGILVKVLGV